MIGIAVMIISGIVVTSMFSLWMTAGFVLGVLTAFGMATVVMSGGD